MSYLDTSIYYVYQLRLENSKDPFYIGKGKRYRIYDHVREYNLCKKTRKNNIIKNAITNGIAVISEKLHDSLTEQEAFDLEMHYIAMYGRLDLSTGILANHTDGGEGASGRIISKDTNLKKTITMMNKSPEEKLDRSRRISESHNKRSDSDKKISGAKISASKKMIPPWNHSKCTEETKTLVWANADMLYNLFLLGHNTRSKLNSCVGNHFKKYYIYGNLLIRFKSGWNPLLDNDWLEWKVSYSRLVK